MDNLSTQEYRNRVASLLSPTANTTPAYNTGLTYPSSALVVTGGGVPQPDVSKLTVPPAGGAPAIVPPTPAAPVAPVAPKTPAPVAPVSGGLYVVKAGDTLGAIAAKNGMTVAQVAALNTTIKDVNKIGVGQQINLGKPAAPATPAAPVAAPVGAPAAPVLTPEQQSLADSQARNEELARKAGAAGLTPDQYASLMGDQNAPTKEETDRIAKELGITALEGEVFKKPSQSSQQMFQTAYDTAGLADLKVQIQKLNDEINRDREEARTAIGAIDENPFLTETSRVGRGKRILDQAEQKITNKLAQVKQIQDLYDRGITEITGMITRNQADFGANQAADEAKLAYLVKKAETQATQLSKSKTSKATGTYLETLAANKKPDLVGNDNTGYYKYDATTKAFVQVIKPSAKAGLDIENQKLQNAKLKKEIESVAAGGEFKPTSEQKALANRATFANMTNPDGSPITFTAEDRARLNTDPQFFYWVLQKASENGIY